MDGTDSESSLQNSDDGQYGTVPLHAGKTHVAPLAAAATFLGYELRPGDRRRLPETNVRRLRNRLRGLRDRWRAGTVSREVVEQRGSRLGGARGARRHVAAAPRDLPGRVVRAVRAIGPGGLTGRRVVRGGSWNNNADNLRPGARNRNRAGNRNDNNGFRVASTLPEPELPRSRPRRARAGASRAGHDEPASPVLRGGTAAAPVLARRGAGRRPPLISP